MSYEQFLSVTRSTLANRYGDDDLDHIMGIIKSYSLKFNSPELSDSRAAIVVKSRPIVSPPTRARTDPSRFALRPPARSHYERLDLDDLPAGCLNDLDAQALRDCGALRSHPATRSSRNTTDDTTYTFRDADLFALTRDTSAYFSGDDFYDIRVHLLILYSIAKWCCWPDPRRACGDGPLCVEIGVRHGVSTVALLAAVRETDGLVISIDNDADAMKVAERTIVSCGLAPWWRPVTATSDDFAVRCPSGIDFLFVDGDHAKPQVERDTANYLGRVRVGGYAAYHDYYATIDASVVDASISGVCEVIEALRTTGKYEILTLAWAYGLSLIRVL